MRTLLSTFLVTLLAVLLAVLTPLSAVAAWSELEIGNRDRFIATMAPVAAEPPVRDVVADRITDQVMRQIDVGPLQDAVRGLLHDAVHSFTTTDSFRAAWRMASSAAQSTANEILTKDNGQAVTIDLAPVTEQVKSLLSSDGVPFANRIPVRHTEITVLDSQRPGGWREVVQGLRSAGVWPGVGTLLLTLVAVLSGIRFHRLRRTLICTGLGYAAGAVLLFVLVAVARAMSLNDLPNDGDRAAAGAIYDALTESLRTAAWAVLGAGLVLALAALFARPGRAVPLTDRLRRLARPHRPGRPPNTPNTPGPPRQAWPAPAARPGVPAGGDAGPILTASGAVFAPTAKAGPGTASDPHPSAASPCVPAMMCATPPAGAAGGVARAGRTPGPPGAPDRPARLPGCALLNLYTDPPWPNVPFAPFGAP